jgi:hypothetical protein
VAKGIANTLIAQADELSKIMFSILKTTKRVK